MRSPRTPGSSPTAAGTTATDPGASVSAGVPTAHRRLAGMSLARSVAVVTLGCTRNEVDSEELAGRLAVEGERLQELAKQFPDLAPLHPHQIGAIGELPLRGDKGDALGKKLDLLGLAAPTPTPRETTGSIAPPRPADAGRTPASR